MGSPPYRHHYPPFIMFGKRNNTTGHEINKIDRMVEADGGYTRKEGGRIWKLVQIQNQWKAAVTGTRPGLLSPPPHLVHNNTIQSSVGGWRWGGADTDGHTVPKSKPLTKSISAVPCGQPAANRPANMQQWQFVTTLLKVCTTTANLGVNGVGGW